MNRKVYFDLAVKNIGLKCLLLLLALSFPAFAVDAQLPNVRFKDVLEGHDVPLGDPLAMIQDSRGFMWFGGTGGLARFDGTSFMHFANDPTKPDSVKFYMAWSLLEDSKGRLWVGSEDGLFSYDYDSQKFTFHSDENGVKRGKIIDIREDSRGRLWVSSAENGFNLYDPETGINRLISHAPGDPESRLPGSVSSSIEDKEGNIWVGTPEGLNKLDPNTFKAKHYQHAYPEDSDEPKLKNVIESLFIDKNERLWVGTGDGLYYFDYEADHYKRFDASDNRGNSLLPTLVENIQQDRDGFLWVAYGGVGISIIDVEKTKFTHLVHDAENPETLSSNTVRAFGEDSVGDIWVGTYPRGLQFFDRSAATVAILRHDPKDPKSISHNTVLSILEHSSGSIWLGTEDGLNLFNPADQSAVHFKFNPDDPNTLSGNAVLSVVEGPDGHIWVGTWSAGLNRFDPVTYENKRYGHGAGPNVWVGYLDSNNMLWFGTIGTGLSSFNPDTEEFKRYSPIENDPTSLPDVVVWNIFEDSQNNFWIATNGGLALMDRENGTFQNFKADDENPSSLSHNNVYDITEDNGGQLWLTTRSGVNLMNREEGTFKRWGVVDGMDNDDIASIIADDHGYLWMGTDTGLSRFHIESKTFQNFNRSNWLTGGYKIGSVLKSSNGLLYFGGIYGLTYFDSGTIKSNLNKPELVFTDFQIFNKPVTIGEPESPLKKSITQTDSITLDYTNTVFSLRFAALSYRNPKQNQYAYQMEGFEKEWTHSGSRQDATYTNLDPGKYTFRIKASNDEGLWNEEGHALEIRILPPPWRTWWAYTIYTLIALSIIAWIVQAQRRKQKRIEEQNRILEIRVAERTSELNLKNKHIEGMLGNIPQGLFTIEKDHSIHPQYSAHLESIFETAEIANKNVSDLLFANTNIGGDVLHSSQQAMNAIVGEDEMSFDFNSSLLIREYQIQIGEKNKILALDWSPIVAEDVVVQLMVSVRDLTQMREMEAEAEVKKRQLDIIGQLLSVTRVRFERFEESAIKYIETNKHIIESQTAMHSETLALLFRNLHTLKGNARTLGFSHISEVVHQVESVYQELKQNGYNDNGEIKWSKEKLLDDIKLVEGSVDEYKHGYYKLLGRGDKSGASRQDGVWMASSVIGIVKSYVNNSQLDKFNSLINRLNSKPFEQVLEGVIDSLPSIATQLFKEPPNVVIHAPGIRVLNDATSLINDVFAHILRNSVDHGIENEAERVKNGKNNIGRIGIRAEEIDHQLVIRVSDDGRGLDLDKLRQKGCEAKLWRAEDTPSPSEIAQLIFCSGISTKDKVSDISGRGVGMDAVKKFLADRGGDITIEIGNATTTTFTPFTLVITLPPTLFVDSMGLGDTISKVSGT